MATIREIKRRIESVAKIRKISSALEIVAATRLKRIESKILNFRPYAEGVKEMFVNVATRSKETHPLMRQDANAKDCLVVFTADRGLCGAFNENVTREVRGIKGEVDIIIIGKKGKNYLKRKGANFIAEYTDVSKQDLDKLIEEILNQLIPRFIARETGRVRIIFNKFRLQLLGKTEDIQILPANLEKQEKRLTDYLYEPNALYMLDKLIPAYIQTQIRAAFLESQAAEEMARMVAMKYATDNANELIEKLSLDYHKERQANITQEISEVLGGTFK